MSAPSTDSRITILRHLGETLAIALAGGATLGLAGVPAGWLSGSILAVAGASLAGRPLLVPTLIMRAILLLIGSLLLAILVAAVGKVTDSGWIAFFFGIFASLIWLFGVSAAGLVLMDVARGLEPPSFSMAFFGGAFSFVKVVAIFLLAVAIGLLYWLAWAISLAPSSPSSSRGPSPGTGSTAGRRSTAASVRV